MQLNSQAKIQRTQDFWSFVYVYVPYMYLFSGTVSKIPAISASPNSDFLVFISARLPHLLGFTFLVVWKVPPGRKSGTLEGSLHSALCVVQWKQIFYTFCPISCLPVRGQVQCQLIFISWSGIFFIAIASGTATFFLAKAHKYIFLDKSNCLIFLTFFPAVTDRLLLPFSPGI